MKMAHGVKRRGIETLEDEIEDIEETEKVFKEGLRIIFAMTDPAAIINEVLSNMIAHEKDKYMRLYMTIQKRAVLGLLAGESAYILFKILSSLAGLTRKESWELDALLLSGDDPEPETSEDDNDPENESNPFNVAILSLDDNAIKIILKEFHENVLLYALKPATTKVRKKFYDFMGRRQAAMFDEDIEYSGKGGRIEDAQQMILTFIQNIADYVPSNNAPRDFEKVGRYTSPVEEGDWENDRFVETGGTNEQE
jgi:hypothetical protein